MNILIYGSGTIGTHLAYVLNNKKNKIYLYVRNKEKQNYFKRKGINITIKNNAKIIKKIILKENIIFINSLNKIKDINFSFIFFTFKLIGNYQANFKKIKTLTNKKTKVILPCSALPDWWLKKFSDRKIKLNFSENKVIAMTMWISGMMNKNNVTIKHTQRGYPLKEINYNSKKECNELRKVFLKKTKSPLVNNIYSEVYLKVINSFAFNLIAIKYNQNNALLAKNEDAKSDIKKIMTEFDEILIKRKLKITQSIEGRIKQTLSSKKHTMSMLFDLRNNKKIEIYNQWKSLKEIISTDNIKQIQFTRKTYNKVIKQIKNEYFI